MSVTASPIRDTDGTVVGLSIVARNITERKRAEQELARSRELLQEAETIAQMGSWEWDMPTDRLSWSKGLFKIFQMTPEDANAPANGQATIPFGLAHRVSPEDRELMRDALHRTISELTRVSAQFRAIRADGRVRVLDWHADPIVDRFGKPVKVIGIVQDITEAKRAQQTLNAASSDLVKYAQELQRLASEQTAADDVAIAALSPRQLEVLRLVAQGMTNAEIARRIFISEGTVK
jgi:PAS domain-containing protein